MFIDADKENNPHYLDWAIRLGRPGTTIVVDNVVWEGAVLDASMDPVNAPGIISALQMMGDDRAAGRHSHPDRGFQRLGRLRPGGSPLEPNASIEQNQKAPPAYRVYAGGALVEVGNYTMAFMELQPVPIRDLPRKPVDPLPR